MSEINREEIEGCWEATVAAIEAIGGEIQAFRVERPATQDAVDAAEQKLGIALPVSFKLTLLNFSRSAQLAWKLPEDFKLPTEFREIFAGDIHWSLEKLVEIEESRKSWVRECFPNPHDPYDQHWHNKLAFHDVGNGDQLAIDLAEENLGAIVYLSHDDGEGHGFNLADSFEDLIQRWSLIGGVGSEDWQWLPFYDQRAAAINPHGQAAQRFRKVIGFRLEETS